MDRVSEPQLDELAEKGIRTLIQVLVATLLGSAAAVVLLPRLAGPMALTLDGPEGSAFWFLSRSSAFVAYLLLWGSMMLGLAITNKMARLWPGGPVAFDLHQHLSLLALGTALFHAFILVGDPYIGYSLSDILIPFRALGYRVQWVGMGQLALYLVAVVVLSFYVRKRLGNASWRAIHFLTYTGFILVLFHGLRSGTDSPALWAQVIYWATGASVMVMTLYRILTIEPERRREKAAGGVEGPIARSEGGSSASAQGPSPSACRPRNGRSGDRAGKLGMPQGRTRPAISSRSPPPSDNRLAMSHR